MKDAVRDQSGRTESSELESGEGGRWRRGVSERSKGHSSRTPLSFDRGKERRGLG